MPLSKLEKANWLRVIEAYDKLPLLRIPMRLNEEDPADISPLYQICEPIEINPEGLKEAKKIVEKMVELMQGYYEITGAGRALAANQIGITKQVVIFFEHSGMTEEFINPEIVWKSDEKNLHWEMCMSGASLGVDVVRPSEIKVRWYDLKGEVHEREFKEFDSRRMQHEIDHLKGLVCYNTEGSIHATLGYELDPDKFKDPKLRPVVI